jgi:hypothetical protein
MIQSIYKFLVSFVSAFLGVTFFFAVFLICVFIPLSFNSSIGGVIGLIVFVSFMIAWVYFDA